MLSKIFKSTKAFTIVELLIVIVVIAIIATLAIISYSGITSKAKLASLQSDLSSGSKTLKLYNSQYGYYPSALDSNGCPSAPTASTSFCIKLAPGNSLSAYTGSANAFTLTVSSGTLLWKVTESIAPQSATAFTLTLVAGTGGSVSGAGVYEAGTNVTITATGTPGYAFASWSGGAGCSGTASHSLALSADTTCTASFNVTPLDIGSGGGWSISQGADGANSAGYTNTSMTRFNSSFIIAAGVTAPIDPLSYGCSGSSANFAFHTGHTVPGWWPLYYSINVSSGSYGKVLNQLEWKKHINAAGNIDVFGTNQAITSSNFSNESLYTYLGRGNVGGYGSEAECTVKTFNFNPSNYGYKWYMVKVVDNVSTLLTYPNVGSQGGWAMYGFRLNKV